MTKGHYLCPCVDEEAKSSSSSIIHEDWGEYGEANENVSSDIGIIAWPNCIVSSQSTLSVLQI